MNKRLAIYTVIFAVLSAILLFSAGFYYKDLYCDGGWYGYPALAMSRNGSPAENRKQIDDLESIYGVKSVFGHRTYYSIRIFYTSLWLKYISKSIVSLKFLGLLELISLLVLTYFLMHRFSGDHLISLLLFAILLNDKRIILIAASDYRPDIMVAVFTCLAFLFFLWKNRTYGLIFAGLTSCLLILVHITAIIPFLSMICFFLFYNALCSKYKLRDNYRYLLVAGLAFLVFCFRIPIFDSLFFPSGHLTPSDAMAVVKSSTINSTAVQKISKIFDQDLLFFIKKEVRRWRSYFVFFNIAELLALLTGVIILFKQSRFSLAGNKKGFSFFIAIVAGLLALSVLDPHTTWRHGIVLVPFFFLMLSCAFQPMKLPSQKYLYVLITLVWVSSFHSLFMTGQLVLQGKKGGYNISRATKHFEEITSNKDQASIIIGPTEIWPFIKEDKNVLIIDIRNGRQFKKIEPIIDSVDYIVINEDYRNWKFEEAFLRHFPNYYFDKKLNISGQGVLLKTSKLRRRVDELKKDISPSHSNIKKNDKRTNTN